MDARLPGPSERHRNELTETLRRAVEQACPPAPETPLHVLQQLRHLTPSTPLWLRWLIRGRVGCN